MEGLFIASIVADLQARLPARNLGWAFPDETSAALLLEPMAKHAARPFNLVIAYRPPAPALYINHDRLEGNPRSPFQRALEGKLRGTLMRIEQLKLDRVIELEFAAGSGFIETPPLRLLFELTGRNANLLILEPGPAFEGKILLTAREITTNRNRFRQVRSGGVYTPPPPYQKPDPRHTDSAELATMLEGRALLEWHKHIDGLGPTLSAELVQRSQLPANQALHGQDLRHAIQTLRELADNPQLSSSTSANLNEQARQRAQFEKQNALRKALREPLEKRLQLLTRQLEDVERARDEALQAIEQREQADTLLAYTYKVPLGAKTISLENVHGSGPTEIALDPTLDAAANANRIYARAKRREDVLEKLEAREPELQAQQGALKQLIERLETMPESELEALLNANNPQEERPAVGLRYRTNNGLEVLVGRNAKENDLLTHRIAKSWDLWFHVQSYPGSHTLLRTQNREATFNDVLEAAAIAAHHSKARGSGNVAVDYVPKKNLWRPKGGKSGAVYYTGQKTVFVDAELPKRPQ